MTNPTKCAICGVTSTQKCGGCKNVAYCGKEHQKIHWRQGHKAECKCYEVATNAVLGRHLRATRDIKCGEIILREMPLIAGPKVASAPICLGCHRLLPPPSSPKGNYYKCSKCAWPMCDAVCEHSAQHRDECALMTSRNYKAKIDYNPDAIGRKEPAYCVVLPMRCILMQQRQPDLYRRFAELEDHLAERLETPLYKVLRANLITFVKMVLGLDDWDDMEVLRIAGRLDTNAFEVRQHSGGGVGKRLRAIYPSAAMISHDCVSNVRHTFDEQMQILFIAKMAIAKGDIIATSYTQPLKSTLMRRSHLSQAKCFECTCRRCADAAELGTYAGAIQCSQCKVGKIVSTNPLQNDAIWKCEMCPHQIPAKQIHNGNAAMQKEIDSLNKQNPKHLEQFIHRYRDTLHEKNTHVLQVKYALTQLYGNAPGFRMNEMNDAALKRKIELCRELLEVADILDGGWSIFRGNLLLDLQEALAFQAQREYGQGLLTRDNCQEKLMESSELLKEAIHIMQLEPEMKVTLQERMEFLASELSSD